MTHQIGMIFQTRKNEPQAQNLNTAQFTP